MTKTTRAVIKGVLAAWAVVIVGLISPVAFFFLLMTAGGVAAGLIFFSDDWP